MRQVDVISRFLRQRFDPRFVLIGVIFLAIATISGWTVADVAIGRADRVAIPVASLCYGTAGPARSALVDSGACDAASAARTVGPYVNGRLLASGAPQGYSGPPQAPAGALPPLPAGPGTPGPLLSAVPLAPSALVLPTAEGEPQIRTVMPPCFFEPSQCRGADGAAGAPGAPGTPGPACPEGTALAPVTFASGEPGYGCVSGPPVAQPTASAEPPPPTSEGEESAPTTTEDAEPTG